MDKENENTHIIEADLEFLEKELAQLDSPMMLGELVSAIEAFDSAIKAYTDDNAAEEIAWCLHQIAVCYRELVKFEQAERYFTASFQAYFKIGDHETGHDVVSELRQLYISSNQVEKLTQLGAVGKQKR